jgi:MFS family permease
MVVLDLTMVIVALPSIQSNLGFSSHDLQWVVDAYAVTFGGLLMLGGRAVERWGKRCVFVAAMCLFSIASLMGGMAVSREMLVIARGVQGLSSAFIAASSLAIIGSSFQSGRRLHRAVGVWAAMSGAAAAAGVLAGGIIRRTSAGAGCC